MSLTSDICPETTWVVIGGSGFVGSGIMQRLREVGVSARSVQAPRLSFSGPRTCAALAEAESTFSDQVRDLQTQCTGVDVVINAAGMAAPDSVDSDSLYGANALLPALIASAVRGAGSGLFIHLSSAAVQGGIGSLDDSPRTAAFSPYSHSKALAEERLTEMSVGLDDVTIVRATSVQGDHRQTTESLRRFARSPLSSVAAPGTQPTPVSSLSGLVDFVIGVGSGREKRSLILLQPWEGGTVSSVLEAAGGRRPTMLPRALCRVGLGAARATSHLLGGRFAGLIRRVELAWFGQPQVHSAPSDRVPDFSVLARTLSPEATVRTPRQDRLGILSQWFDPETGPAALPGVFARAMDDRGHAVSVLTGFPNYPDGEIYPGYSQSWRSKETLGDVTVVRVPLVLSHDASALGRMSNYLSFAFSATFLGGRTLNRAKAVWVYNSPATVSLPLLIHTRFGRKPYFLHVQDLWPESLINSGMFPGGLVGRAAGAVIRTIVGITERQATAIGVISPSVKQLILDRNPKLDASKIHYVPNPTDELIFKPLNRADTSHPLVPWAGQFTFMYVGAVGELQGLDTLLDAAKHLSGEALQVVIVGDGVARERLAARVTKESISNVTLFGRVAKESVPSFMATSDVQIVSLAQDEFLRHTTPSKISSIMASAKPIVGQISGDGADLITRSGCGLTAEPGNPVGLSNVMRLLAQMSSSALDEMGTSGLHYYRHNMSADVTTTTILKALGYSNV